MTKNGARALGAQAFSAAFVVFSVAVALGWLYDTDQWVLRTAQEHHSGFLDLASNIFSFPGGIEVAGTALVVLLAMLFLRDRRVLVGRLLVAFVATELLELAMKLYLPQAPIPEGSERTEDFAPLLAIDFPHPYPSGHILRGVILLGALYLLSDSRLLRIGLVVALFGLAASRVYPGVHWTSDVLGGALLGMVALLWAFEKEN
jgi:membrane-associated phospholipid phosphatase